jgi:cbb3-type cytochrome oxidase cytochrome c subunit
MKRVFVVLSILILLFFFWQIGKDYDRPYLSYQEKYKELLSKTGEGEPELAAFQLGARQQWIADLGRVDRCGTCHLGTEDPRFQAAPQPFRTHPDADSHPFEKFGCTICHGGQGLAASVGDAHGPTGNWSTAIYHENFLQKSCSLCHGETIGESATVLARGKEIFYEYGCRGCHKVEGKERKKVGWPIRKIGEKVRVDWLFRWLRNPREYLPKTRMPDFILIEQEAADIALFLVPRRQDPAEAPAGVVERGRKMFNEYRCVTCHAVDGKGGEIGPDLAKVGSKIRPGWLLKWLRNPHEIMPSSQMPVYNFTEQDIRDLAAFLIGEYVDLELPEDEVARNLSAVASGNVRKGKALIEKYGCTGCHEIEGVEDRGENGSELTRIGDIHISRLEFGEVEVPRERRTVPNWLYNKIRKPRIFKDDLKMPDYHFTEGESEAVTTYLLSLTGEKVPSQFILPLGERPSDYDPQGDFGEVLEKYRCLVCHRIRGKGGTLAPDLSQEGSRVRQEWLVNYMKKPDTIRPILVERMIPLKIPDADIRTLDAYFRTTLVDSRVESLAGAVKGMRLGDSETILRGGKLYFEKYGCDACHQINLIGGTIGPDLTNAGKRLRPEWVVQWLRNPKMFLKRSVEPVYAFPPREVEELTAFLLGPKGGRPKGGEGKP